MVHILLDPDELARLVPLPAAVAALSASFQAPLPVTPHRTRIPGPGGDLLVMGAYGDRGAGVKIVGVATGNPARGLASINGVYVLLDPDTLVPRLLLDGAALTTLRTSAVSALATDRLARADAHRLVVFGAGTQARAHIQALAAIRPLTDIRVVAPDAGRANTAVADARAHGLPARLGNAGDVREADIVCTCTTSPAPVFDGRDLPAGVHVTAIGSYKPDRRELDDTAIRRGRLVVEDRVVAFAEAGDLAIPAANGLLGPGDVAADLPELLGGATVRETAEDITIFKSVGLAHEDLAVATTALATIDRSPDSEK
jgi:ornithine cyclodeaminase/alanine dehydrogenase-like protein (mu-crystallin family)